MEAYAEPSAGLGEFSGALLVSLSEFLLAVLKKVTSRSPIRISLSSFKKGHFPFPYQNFS
ncbi:MAG: hypothetical protein ACJAUD_000570 [Crocinitomicaceae bacterium]|jgi:hypothetical protein